MPGCSPTAIGSTAVPRPTATSCPAAPACLPSGACGLSSAEGHAQPLAGCRDVWMGWVFTSPLYYSLWECIKAVNGFNYLLTARHSGIVLTNTKQRRKCSIILHPTLSIQFPASHLWNGSNNTSLSPTLLPPDWQNSCGRAVVPAQHRAHQQDVISAAEQGLTAAQPPPQHKAQLCSTHCTPPDATEQPWWLQQRSPSSLHVLRKLLQCCFSA